MIAVIPHRTIANECTEFIQANLHDNEKGGTHIASVLLLRSRNLSVNHPKETRLSALKERTDYPQLFPQPCKFIFQGRVFLIMTDDVNKMSLYDIQLLHPLS